MVRVVVAVVMVAVIKKIIDFVWARLRAAVFSMCRDVWDVAYSTSCGPTRSGLEPAIKKVVHFHVWACFWTAVCFHV